MHARHQQYALVTAARNEAEFIGRTIQAVIRQTVKPVVWIIVSDRSVDRTDDIVANYSRQHPFIHLVRNEAPSARNTSAKVRAFNMGLEQASAFEYAYVGNLDADISFGDTYFETLLTCLEIDKDIGVIGGRIHQAVDGGGEFRETNSSVESVAGAVQLFRRECFEKIGGYRSIPGGMEDGLAEKTARYYGWKTRSVKGLPVFHHREVGTVGRSAFRARFSNGFTEYLVGFSYIYHLVRAARRLRERPYIVGSVLLTLGFVCGLLSGRSRVVPYPIRRFIQKEQMAILKSRLRSRLGGLSMRG